MTTQAGRACPLRFTHPRPMQTLRPNRVPATARQASTHALPDPTPWAWQQGLDVRGEASWLLAQAAATAATFRDRVATKKMGRYRVREWLGQPTLRFPKPSYIWLQPCWLSTRNPPRQACRDARRGARRPADHSAPCARAQAALSVAPWNREIIRLITAENWHSQHPCPYSSIALAV